MRLCVTPPPSPQTWETTPAVATCAANHEKIIPTINYSISM